MEKKDKILVIMGNGKSLSDVNFADITGFKPKEGFKFEEDEEERGSEKSDRYFGASEKNPFCE